MSFIATVSYELSKDTTDDARRLFRAELVGRRYFDRWEGKRMPETTVWARKTAAEGETVIHLKAQCERDLRAAAAAVSAMRLPIRLVRAWIQVSGAGTFGLIEGE